MKEVNKHLKGYDWSIIAHEVESLYEKLIG